MPLVEFWINFNPADVLYNFLVKPKELRKLKEMKMIPLEIFGIKIDKK
jgi:hypothetical protein